MKARGSLGAFLLFLLLSSCSSFGAKTLTVSILAGDKGYLVPLPVDKSLLYYEVSLLWRGAESLALQYGPRPDSLEGCIPASGYYACPADFSSGMGGALVLSPGRYTDLASLVRKNEGDLWLYIPPVGTNLGDLDLVVREVSF